MKQEFVADLKPESPVHSTFLVHLKERKTANNGSAYDAWVCKSDGRLVKLSVITPPAMRAVLPPLTMTITRFGESPHIEAPR